MSYLARTADALIAEWLEAFGAIVIEGPKWCGKTTTAEQVAKSVIKLQDPDMRDEYLATAAAKPSLLLIGDNPRLIDEWQDAPVLWDTVRTRVDNSQDQGLFILTGSNAVDKTKIHHSGTGRIAKMDMLPMSLFTQSSSQRRTQTSRKQSDHISAHSTFLWKRETLSSRRTQTSARWSATAKESP